MASEESYISKDVARVRRFWATFVNGIPKVDAPVRAETPKMASGIQILDVEQLIRVDVEQPIDIAVAVGSPERVLRIQQLTDLHVMLDLWYVPSLCCLQP